MKINSDKLTALSILSELISINSDNRAGEQACAEKINEIFSSIGISSQVDTWGAGFANVEARIDGQCGKALMFASHLDVVPANSADWQSPPFEPTIRAGRLYGRGAVDMKSGMAAVMAAIGELKREGAEFKRGVIFAATCDEETGSEGAIRYFNQNPEMKGNLIGIVVPEPTSMNLAIAHKGILWLKIGFKGVASHGSMPQLGVNAFENAVLLHSRLKSLGIEKYGNDFLGNCSISCNKIQAGNAVNIIPDYCEACYDIRIAGDIDKQRIINKVQEQIDILAAANPSFKADLKVLRYCPQLNNNLSEEFIVNISDCCGKAAGAIGYTTDSPFFAEFGAPVVVMGPGEAGMCHKKDEYIDIEELKTAQAQYKKLITYFCL